MSTITSIRRPKTIQELRINEALSFDVDFVCLPFTFKVRAKRNNLPTSFTDLQRTTERNWKQYRLTQYK